MRSAGLHVAMHMPDTCSSVMCLTSLISNCDKLVPTDNHLSECRGMSQQALLGALCADDVRKKMPYVHRTLSFAAPYSFQAVCGCEATVQLILAERLHKAKGQQPAQQNTCPSFHVASVTVTSGRQHACTCDRARADASYTSNLEVCVFCKQQCTTLLCNRLGKFCL